MRRSIEIYLKPGIQNDDRIFAIWKILQSHGRSQDVFRRALLKGLSGLQDELPEDAQTLLKQTVKPPIIRQKRVRRSKEPTPIQTIPSPIRTQENPRIPEPFKQSVGLGRLMG